MMNIFVALLDLLITAAVALERYWREASGRATGDVDQGS